MTEHDRDEFDALWLRSLALHNQVASNEVLDDVFEVLQNFHIDDIKRALLAHKRNPKEGRFMPLPADIVRYIVGDSDSLSHLAWSKAERAISSPGIYASVVFDDSIIMAVIEDLGGWIKFCSSSGDEFPFIKNDFNRLYRGYLNRPPSVWPRRLIGLEEADTNRYGLPAPDPYLLGVPEQAKLVYEMGGNKKRGVVPMSDYIKKFENKTKTGLEHSND